MYHVTIIWQDCEIGYGEGESLKYAKEEAIDSVGEIYLEGTDRKEWQFLTVKDNE